MDNQFKFKYFFFNKLTFYFFYNIKLDNEISKFYYSKIIFLIN